MIDMREMIEREMEEQEHEPEGTKERMEEEHGENDGWRIKTAHIVTPVTSKSPEKTSEKNQDQTTNQAGSSPKKPGLIRVQPLSGTPDPPKYEFSQYSGSASEEEEQNLLSSTKQDKEEKNKIDCEDADTKEHEEQECRSPAGLVVNWVNQKMKDRYQRKIEKSLKKEEENKNKVYVICKSSLPFYVQSHPFWDLLAQLLKHRFDVPSSSLQTVTGGIIQEIPVAKIEQEKRWRLEKDNQRRQKMENRFKKWEEKKIKKKTEKKLRSEMEKTEEGTEKKSSGLLKRLRKWQQKKVEKKEKLSQADPTSPSEKLQTESSKAPKHPDSASVEPASSEKPQTESSEAPKRPNSASVEPALAPYNRKVRLIFVKPINPVLEPTDLESHPFSDFLYTSTGEGPEHDGGLRRTEGGR